MFAHHRKHDTTSFSPIRLQAKQEYEIKEMATFLKAYPGIFNLASEI